MDSGKSSTVLEVLTCPACNRYDSLWVKYDCNQDATHELELPPDPNGHPLTRHCPGTLSAPCPGQMAGQALVCVHPLCSNQFQAI